MMNDILQYNLVRESLLKVRRADGRRESVSLTQVFSGLADGNIVSFEALQPHQKQPWYCFLVQLAVIALSRDDRSQLPVSPEVWEELLLNLTNGKKAPWSLIVEDISLPAFMQPPVPESSLEDAKYKPDVATPDELDILITSKNHDLKQHRISSPRPEHWIYALVALQTLEGFLGRGNYGIVRMNGGFGNRPFVAITSEFGWSARFRRDVSVLLQARKEILNQYGYDDSGHALLWLLPWDGAKTSGIPLEECDPLFIEICRRIRFRSENTQIKCYRANTKGTRVSAPDELNGVTGDPWTPIDISDAKALTVGGNGFSYQLLHDILLSDEYAQCAAMKPTQKEKDGGFLIATTLVRGQGKTEGFHHRVVPIPPHATKLFSSVSEREKLGKIAAERIDTAETVQRNILYPALRSLLSAGSDENVDSEKIQPGMRSFDAAVDAVFFEDLWESLKIPREKARRQWQERLYEFARDELEKSIESTPLPSMRRYRAISTARSIFYGNARRQLSALFPQDQTEESHEQLAGC
ncbi:MAG: type I-E CRISPR-associated protein Cse1/CasA [Planctomycetes bacterium]|nr:type I-E CRISPR-associated protein Cse1/CasA [Planctomycetota bacterium]